MAQAARKAKISPDVRSIHVDPAQFKGAQLRFEGRVAEAIRIVVHEGGLDISFPEGDRPAAAPAPKPARGGRADRSAADPRLPAPGTTLQGRYHGEVFKAKVLDGGKVRMNGVVYGTLSAAAKAARGGKPTSGFVFFKVKG